MKTSQDQPFLLQVCNLHKRFGGVYAVKDITFDVPTGIIYGILGPNGSGKTTLFNLISGVTKPDAGQVFFQGNECTAYPAHSLAKLGIARTFQNLRLFTGMTVLENVLVGGHLITPTNLWTIGFVQHSHKKIEAELYDKALQWIEWVGIQEYRDLLANQLPYGAARRLEIARALMSNPKLLLLDEPAAGMNPNEAASLSDLIRSIRDQGVTVVIIEHNVRLMVSLCDTILAIDHGEFLAIGTPNEIVRHPLVIEAYIGTSNGLAK
ncbi:MAG: ABC transporter ATP-binding protein [bacterium]|nr:ABC transporter ATP-binding protein [bacterium]